MSAQRPPDWFDASYAFIIGIDEYEGGGISPLTNAVKDAEGIRDILSDSLPQYKVEFFPNATDSEILDIFEKRIPAVVKTTNTQVIIYYAGHGVAQGQTASGNPKGYILPSNAKNDKDLTHAIKMETIREKLRNLPVKPRHLLLVLDCCFAGAFKSTNEFRGEIGWDAEVIYKQRYDHFIRYNAWQVVTSSSYNQKTVGQIGNDLLTERAETGGRESHSPFCSFLMKGLSGEADANGDGLITVSELYSYLRNNVDSFIEKKAKGHFQTAMLFPIDAEHDNGEYLFLNKGCALNLENFDPKRNPYKGLEPYGFYDSAPFYGRDEAIKEVVERVKNNKITIVAGASGSGKTSLVMAGVLRNFYKETDTPFIITPDSRYDYLAQLREQLVEVKRNIQQDSNKGIVVYIDQLERLFTRHPNYIRIQFLEELMKMLADLGERVRIIVTIRTEFEIYFRNSILKEYWTDANRYTLKPPKSHELRDIIEKPAHQRLIRFNPPSLVNTIVGDADNEEGVLPWLSLFMQEMYNRLIERDQFDEFTNDDYRKSDKMPELVQARAEALFKKLDYHSKATMRKLMPRMMPLSAIDIKGKRVYRHELKFPLSEKEKARHKMRDRDGDDTAMSNETKRANRLFNRMSDNCNRLLVSDVDENGRQFYVPAHTGILRSWKRNDKWIGRLGRKLRVMELFDQVRSQATRYAETNFRSRSLLFKDREYKDDLQRIERYKRTLLNCNENRFVDDSNRRRRYARGWRTFWYCVGAAGAITLIVLGIILSTTKRQSEINRILSRAQSVAKYNPTHAYNLANEVLKKDSANKEAKDIITELFSTPEVTFYHRRFMFGDTLSTVTITPNDSCIIATGKRSIKILDSRTGNSKTITGQENVDDRVEVSPDSRHFAVRYRRQHRDGPTLVKIFSMEGKLVKTIHADDQFISGLGFAGNSKLLAGDSIFEISRNRAEKVNIKFSCRVVVSSDGNSFFAYEDDSDSPKMLLYSSSWKEIRRVELEKSEYIPYRNLMFYTARFADKDRYILVTSLSGEIIKIDVNGLVPVPSFPILNNHIPGVLISNESFACAWNYRNHPNNAAIFDDKGKALWFLFGHTSPIVAAAFFNNSTNIVTADRMGCLLVWNLRKDFRSYHLGLRGFNFSDSFYTVTLASDRSIKETQYSYDLQSKLIQTDSVKLGPGDISMLNNDHVFISRKENSITIKNKRTGKSISVKDNNFKNMTEITASKNSTLFSFLFDNGNNEDKHEVKIFNNKLQALTTFTINNFYWPSIEFSPQENYFIAKELQYVNPDDESFNTQRIMNYMIGAAGGGEVKLEGTHKKSLRQIYFDGVKNVVLIYDSVICTYNLITRRIVNKVPVDLAMEEKIFAGHSGFYFSISGDNLKMWKGKDLVETFPINNDGIDKVFLTKNLNQVFAVTEEGIVYVWYTRYFFLNEGKIVPLNKEERRLYELSDS